MERKKNSKSKSVIIDGDLHYKFKVFCKGKNLKIGAVLEDLVLMYLSDYKNVQNKIDNIKEKNTIA